MSSYKLTYFNIPGAAEFIRYIFAYAGKKYEDNRIDFKDWPTLKPSTPFGKVPILEVDGKVVNQSVAIGRFLAKRFGLVSSDEWEALQTDALIDTLQDLKRYLTAWYLEEDPKKKEKIKEEMRDVQIPFYYGKFEKILASNPSGWLVGSQISWADLVFAEAFSSLQERFPDSLKQFPALSKLVERVNSLPNIKTWLETRPKSAMPF